MVLERQEAGIPTGKLHIPLPESRGGHSARIEKRIALDLQPFWKLRAPTDARRTPFPRSRS